MDSKTKRIARIVCIILIAAFIIPTVISAFMR